MTFAEFTEAIMQALWRGLYSDSYADICEAVDIPIYRAEVAAALMSRGQCP